MLFRSGLSDLPVVGRLFAHNRKETQETDIVLTLTPRIVRVLNLTEDDLRPFRVGRPGTGTGAILDLPILAEPPGGALPPGTQALPNQPPPPGEPPPTTAPAEPRPAAPIQAPR